MLPTITGHRLKTPMHEGQRNKPLSKRQIEANKLISRRRYIIEQCFGTAKQLFNMARASYISTTKVNAQVIKKNICMNLLNATNKILISDVAKGENRRKKMTFIAQ